MAKDGGGVTIEKDSLQDFIFFQSFVFSIFSVFHFDWLTYIFLRIHILLLTTFISDYKLLIVF